MLTKVTKSTPPIQHLSFLEKDDSFDLIKTSGLEARRKT